jgi:hypothetical protein
MGLYTLVATRADGTVLTGGGSVSDIFNVDHQNHVTHTAAPFINSFEDDVAQMNLETDPAPLGAVSLSAALSDEIKRLRFAMHQVKRNINASVAPAHWYTPVTAGNSLVLAAQAARLESNQLQNIPNNVFTTINFQTIVYDYGPLTLLESAGFSGLRATVNGTYIVGATMGFGSNTITGDYQLALVLDTNSFVGTEQHDSGGAAVVKSLTVNAVVKLTAGQTMRVKVKQTTGGILATDFASMKPAFWMSLIGRPINTFP